MSWIPGMMTYPAYRATRLSRSKFVHHHITPLRVDTAQHLRHDQLLSYIFIFGANVWLFCGQPSSIQHRPRMDATGIRSIIET